MKRLLRAALAALLLVPLAVSALVLTAGPAAAATLTRVTGFGNNPTNLNMYLYVPDSVAAKPALLVLVHYCGGSAGAIFNGNGRDFATAADRYGYVVVVPEATRDGHCFDVSTRAGLTRDGGSDSTGIMAMVAWTRQRHNVDPARIVVSGFSSGAMMTNVLAAEYPDVFSAGSAFSGFRPAASPPRTDRCGTASAPAGTSARHRSSGATRRVPCTPATRVPTRECSCDTAIRTPRSPIATSVRRSSSGPTSTA